MFVTVLFVVGHARIGLELFPLRKSAGDLLRVDGCTRPGGVEGV